MSRFGVDISPGEWKVSRPAITPSKPTQFRKQINRLKEKPARESKLLDRVCAYLSFFVLVFAALCIFMPEQMQAFIGWY